MKLTLHREPSFETSTPGKLYIDDIFFAFTLEDKVREQFYPTGSLVDPAKWKVQNATAIPSGKYSVITDYSTRFKKLMPHILGVTGFTGVRLHGGNTSEDTEGCILCGSLRVSLDKIANCAPTIQKLIERLVDSNGATLTIEPALSDEIRAHSFGVKL